ncbi:MAG: Protein of unknown function (DUF1064) [Namikivirus sakae]|uniref:DUF1064 domain-containing protein n=1 Tax=Bacteriophage sp. TaxID=38018 RepID=A0ABY5TU50_9VIRU|nr:MAG: Protein of unknown function (DUF1064) [Bacteriophage sp.]
MWSGRNKYHAKKTTVDGITFDSRREADRYLVLKSMEEDGAIEDLRRQVRYELIPAFDVDGRHYRPVFYMADFAYVENGREVVEDVKGMRTDVYKLKSKLFARRYGKAIRET